MGTRKRLTFAVAALTISVGFVAVAQAAITSQTITSTTLTPKQDKKQHGAGDITVIIDTAETPPTPVGQTAETTYVDFDKDFKISPGKLGRCTQAQLNGTTTAQAKANCRNAVVGTGSARSCSAFGGCGALAFDLEVTAFNGAPEGGNPVIYLHAKGIGAIAALPPLILKGVYVNSPLAGFGRRLVVDVPDTSSTGTHLTQFITHVGVLKNGVKKKVKGKKNKKTGKRKVKKVPQYYAMARCSDRTWTVRSETSFRAGGGTLSDTYSSACKQKKSKKKKKKGKKKKKK
jgi:hypothetical protein